VTKTILPAAPAQPPSAARVRFARRLTHFLLSRVTGGRVILHDDEGEHRFGSGELEAVVHVRDHRSYFEVMRHTSVGLGESYLRGWWDTDDLTTFLRILETSLLGVGQRLDRLARLTAPLSAPWRYVTSTNKTRDRDNIRAHYDLSNEFFALMLDETMSYSCAIFETPDTSLADASRAKIDQLCRDLRLGAEDHLLEIGTGWGGLAVHAATNYGCRVTTTTISDAQFSYATNLVRARGLEHRVTVLNQDYRDLEGTFDKVVSVEMIEAIGWRQLDTYFKTCARLLSPTGLMALQAIVIDDKSYERAKTHDDFIREFIFPGGFLPSIEAMIRSITSFTDLRVVGLRDIGVHYAETLRRWGENLEKNADEVAALDMGEEFTRLWNFYLCYCEAGFLERHVSDVQLLLAGHQWRDQLVHEGHRS